MAVSRTDLLNLYKDCSSLEEWYSRSAPYMLEAQNTLTEPELDNLAVWLQEVMKTTKLKQQVQHEFYKEINTCDTSYVTIHMAGDYDTAIQAVREFTFETGACYQITACDYVYTGGKESGITARVICYPRFPKSDDELFVEALDLAYLLAEKLCQKSFTLETQSRTHYFGSNKELHGK